MKFQQILAILRARLRTIAISLIVVVAVSVTISLLLPKTYEASTSLVVNYKGFDPVSGNSMPSTMAAAYLATQVDIIGSKTVAMAVVDNLHLADVQSIKDDFQKATGGNGDIREWLADLLLKKLKVVPARESNVVTITFAGTSPEFVAAVANAFADEYQKEAVQLKVQPLRQASAYFNEQIKGLRDKLEQAQARLSKYQQEKGLVNVDATHIDDETTRLTDLSAQLAQVQATTADASSRSSPSQGSMNESPDVVANPLVQSMKSSLAQAEANFSQLSQQYDVNHPQYQAAKAEVEKRRSALETQIAIASNSLNNTSRIAKQRQRELEAAVAAQKSKILVLNRERDELSVLMREVDGAQRTYDAAITRMSQTSLEGGANQVDVAVLSPALTPRKPSSPKLLLNLILSIAFGTAFGIGLSLLLEMLDRRVHSSDDMAGLQIAVLTEMNWGKREARRNGRFALPKLFSGRRARLA